jgi:adenylate cyclase
LATENPKRKLVALVSADVQGYSRLMQDNEEATVATLKEFRQLMTELIEKHRGRVVDSPGDNLLAEFASVVEAVRSAVEVQEELKTRNEELPQERRMKYRMGINVGDVISEEGRIYGDGVNIAARIESLAEGGGICIAGTVYDQVRNKLELEYEFLGEQRVKNMAEPVRVYRVGTAVAAASRETSSEPKSPDKPSIAVLPFVNISGDSEQEYFSDGLTEDLITDLSRFSGMFVISRHSVFFYKGKAIKTGQISAELGVRYVVEGSVRKAGDRVRISAQLIDAATGGHLWADRYDRELKNIFTLQDELTQQIVMALKVKVTQAEQARVMRKETTSLNAYDYVLRGRSLANRYTKEDNAQARLMYEKAIELEPAFAAAYAYLGWSYYLDWVTQWSRSPELLERAFELGKKALVLDDALAMAYRLLGHVDAHKNQYEQAIAEVEKAITIDPNDADGYAELGEALIWAGRPAEGIELVEKAIRLNPHCPLNYFFALGCGHMFAKQYDEAIVVHGRAITRNPDFLGSHLALAFIYSRTGRTAEARSEVDEIRRISPGYLLEVARERLPFRDQTEREDFFGALRAAGLE